MLTYWTLLRKDWRLNRVAVIGGLLLLCGPYLIAACAGISDYLHNPALFRGRNSQIPLLLLTAASAGLVVSALMAAVFGGIAFALERREGWGDFLAVLPPTRWRVAISKLIVALVCIASMWLFNIAVIMFAFMRWPDRFESRATQNAMLAWPWLVVSCPMLFGIAWRLSSSLRSPALSASISIAVTAVTLMLVTQLARICLLTSDEQEMLIFFGSWLVGIAFAATGTMTYVRRIAS